MYVRELRLFEIGGHPDVVERNHRHQTLTRLHHLARFYVLLRDYSVHGRHYSAIAQVQFCRGQVGTGLFDGCRGGCRLCRGYLDLLLPGTRFVALSNRQSAIGSRT